MLKKFQTHIDQNLPFLYESKLLIAISGGLDSVALTHLCKALNLKIILCHCNFKLRGAASDADEGFVLQLAEKLEIQVVSESFETENYARINKISTQMAARTLRYDWFQKLKTQLDIDYVLTAHHADDNLETFLINLSRGTGLDGLTGIPEINDYLIRPLLKFSRLELEHFVNDNDILWREDASNATTKYLRNKLRHDVIPILKGINSQLLQNFEKTTEHLKDAKSIIDESVDTIANSVIESVEDSCIKLSIEELKKLNNPKAYLFELLKEYGFTAWKDVNALLEAQSGKQVFSKTHRLVKNREHLLLSEIPEEYDGTIEISANEREMSFSLGNLSFNEVDIISESAQHVAFLDKSKLLFPLTLRKWEEGDFFYPSGMVGKKKLSKYFKDEKFSLLDKENVWLLCSGNDIVWLINHRTDNRFIATKATPHILKVEIK